jgi:hypothetical protein
MHNFFGVLAGQHDARWRANLWLLVSFRPLHAQQDQSNKLCTLLQLQLSQYLAIRATTGIGVEPTTLAHLMWYQLTVSMPFAKHTIYVWLAKAIIAVAMPHSFVTWPEHPRLRNTVRHTESLPLQPSR